MGYFRIDIKNFDQTIFDTSDLSTIRGASFAANLLPKYLYLKCGGENKRHDGTSGIIIEGASTLLAQCENAAEFEGKVRDELTKLREMTPDEIQSSENNQETLLGYVAPHLCILTASSAQENLSEALNEISLKMARAQQTTMGGDIITPRHSRDKCAIDRFRPAQTEYYMPGDEKDNPSHVSYASATRREMGRSARRRDYYTSYLGVENLTGLDFTNTFEEIVQLTDEQKQLVPQRLQNKVCVFAMDMTGLGPVARDAEKGGAKACAEWSKKQVEAQKNILKAITEKALSNRVLWQTTINQFDPIAEKKTETQALRLETLMLGGDECLAIFPAWCLEDVVSAINTAKDDGYRFGSGFVIAPSKTPLRQLREMAETLCNEAKRSKYDFGLQYHITGHVDVISETFVDDRLKLFGLDPNDMPKTAFDHAKSVNVFSLDLDQFNTACKAVRILKGKSEDEGVSHSRLTRFIKDPKNRIFMDASGNSSESLGDRFTANRICKQDSLGGRDENPNLVPLLHLAMLWSFVIPEPVHNTHSEMATEEKQESTDTEPAS